METVPKKFLGVSNLVFILPDDFEGDIGDAVNLIAEYLSEITENIRKCETKEESSDGTSMFESLMKRGYRDRLSAKFVFYEFDEKTQTYKESSRLDNDR